MNYRSSIIIVLVFIMYSCGVKKMDIAGEYENERQVRIMDKVNYFLFKKYKNDHPAKLNLFGDSTYCLEVHSMYTYSGYWSINKNDLTLFIDCFVKISNNTSDTTFYYGSEKPPYIKMKIRRNKIIKTTKGYECGTKNKVHIETVYIKKAD